VHDKKRIPRRAVELRVALTDVRRFHRMVEQKRCNKVMATQKKRVP